MIETTQFQQLEKQHNHYRQQRHELIKESADILKESKKAIFSLHRNDKANAKASLEAIEQHLTIIKEQIKQEPALRYEGAFSAALEEYAEAYLFFQFLEDGSITMPPVVELQYTEALGALCDFTGEIVRKTVLAVTDEQYEKVKTMHEIVAEIIEQLIALDMTGKLRNKYDQAKRNLKKLEEIRYDLKINLKQ